MGEGVQPTQTNTQTKCDVLWARPASYIHCYLSYWIPSPPSYEKIRRVKWQSKFDRVFVLGLVYLLSLIIVPMSRPFKVFPFLFFNQRGFGCSLLYEVRSKRPYPWENTQAPGPRGRFERTVSAFASPKSRSGPVHQSQSKSSESI